MVKNKNLLVKKARSQADMMNLQCKKQAGLNRYTVRTHPICKNHCSLSFFNCDCLLFFFRPATHRRDCSFIIIIIIFPFWWLSFNTRVMSVAVPIPALASVSVLQSAAVSGSVVGVVGPL